MENLEKYISLAKTITESTDSTIIVEAKKEADAIYEKHLSKIKFNESLNNVSFSDVRSLFEEMSSALFASTKGRDIIGKYVKIISENKTLSNIFLFHEKLAKPEMVSDIKYYLGESVDVVKANINKTDLSNGLSNLVSLLKEAADYLNEYSWFLNDDVKIFNESISYLLNNSKTLKNMGTYSNHISKVSESVERNIPKESVLEKKNIDEIINSTLESFNQKYAAKLDESQAGMIKALVENNDKKDIFEKYKSECLSLMEELIPDLEANDETNDLAINFKKAHKSLTEKVFNEETLSEDLSYLSELNQLLKEPIKNE